MNLGAQITSTIRIIVAAGIGTAISLAQSKWGIDADGETIAAAMTGAIIGVYYAAAREIEKRWPRLRFLGLSDPES